MTGRRVATVTDRADALQRALRTLWQGFGTDALIAIGAGLVLLLDGGDVLSPVFWAGVGVLIVKSVLVSLASYLQRLRKEPAPLATPADPNLTDEYHEAIRDGLTIDSGGNITITQGELTITGDTSLDPDK